MTWKILIIFSLNNKFPLIISLHYFLRPIHLVHYCCIQEQNLRLKVLGYKRFFVSL
jgi:hypothetical protein